jgi:hypothetical protein
MATAKQGYPVRVVSRLLTRNAPAVENPGALIDRLNGELRPTVHEVVRPTPNILKVILKAPLAPRAFKPGNSTGYRIMKRWRLSPAGRRLRRKAPP